MNHSPVQPGDVLANKYRVDRVLGVGGMGVVVQATHVQLDERVALKFMLPEALANAEVAGRFLREARLAVKLKSEHVAKVMDVGTLESGSPYIVMEFLEGTDLNQLLEKHGPLPFADVAEYVIQACDAIAEAHALGIVHRDLKPANLFLARRPDGAPLIKVLDFGISKANQLGEAGGTVTKTATMMGSPFFMSPEQMRSAKDVDLRSDVWSMGVVLYQLLTARLPFESDTLGGIMSAVLQDDPSMLSTYRPDVPHAFEAIVRRCLERNRNARAQSVGEIAMTLAPYAPARAKTTADRVVALSGGGGMGHGTQIMTSPLSAAAREAGFVTGSGGVTGSGPVLGAAPVTDSGRVLGSAPPPGSVTGAPIPAPRRVNGAGLALVALVLVGVAAFFGYRHTHSAAAEPVAQASPVIAPAAPSVTATPTPIPTVTVTETAAARVSDVAPNVPATAATAPEARGRVTARGERPVPFRSPAPSGAPIPPPGPKKNVLDDRN
jgi:tRNA A-37 threonylcarbamoyl transferase component Bud32